jgi:hypothetical protein
VNRDNLIAFYEADLNRYGPDDARSLHWVGQRTQWARFEVIYQAGSWEGASVADVGCGLGDLAGFLTAKGHRVKPGPGPVRSAGFSPQGGGGPGAGRSQGPLWYNGYDVTPAMVQAARRKHPQGAFHLRDVLSQGFVGQPDYVVASGTFNIRLEEHERWFRDMIAAMYAACRRAVAFNFLGLPEAVEQSKGPPQGAWAPLARWNTIYYEARPQDVLSFCRDLAPRVHMKSGYLPDDHTVFLYRE